MGTSAACGTSTLTGAAEAAREAAEMAAHGLGGSAVDLVLVFVSPQHVDQARTVAEVVHDRLAPRVLAGACGESVIGRGRELEGVPEGAGGVSAGYAGAGLARGRSPRSDRFRDADPARRVRPAAAG
jgi:small ligand-binding sensory domain FIST